MFTNEEFETVLTKAKEGDASAGSRLLEQYNTAITDLINNQAAGTSADVAAIHNQVVQTVLQNLGQVGSKDQLDQLVTNTAVTIASATVAELSSSPINNTISQTGEIRFDPNTGQPLGNTGPVPTPSMLFDPNTGKPIGNYNSNTGTIPTPSMLFDPNTGQPLGNTGAIPTSPMGFDPNTGKPIGNDNSNTGAIPTQSMLFDPNTGQPLGNTGAIPTSPMSFDPNTGQPLGNTGAIPTSSMGFDPNTGQPLGNTGFIPAGSMGYDPNTGKPIGQSQGSDKRSIILLSVLCGVLVVGLIGFCGWWFFLRDRDTSAAEEPIAQVTETSPAEVTAIPDVTPIPEQIAEAQPSSIPDATVKPEATRIPDATQIPDARGNVIGKATIIIRDKDTLRKRTEPSTRSNSTVIKNDYANYGEVYDVYDVVSADGYTWYEIGDDIWVADKSGKWISYQSY